MDVALLERNVKRIVKEYTDQCEWPKYSATRLTRAGARAYVKQWSVFTRNSRQAWANVVGNCPETEVRRFIVRENLYEEEGIEEKSHFLILIDAGLAVGLSEEQIYSAEPLPATRAAMLIWETLTKNRHWMIGCAAKLVLEMPADPECGNVAAREHQNWKSKLGLTEHQARFWDTHEKLDLVHGAGALDLLAKYLPKQNIVTEEDILQTVEDSMYAFKLYMDGLAAAALAAEAVEGDGLSPIGGNQVIASRAGK